MCVTTELPRRAPAAVSREEDPLHTKTDEEKLQDVATLAKEQMESEWRHKRHQSMALHSEAKQARMAPNAEERAGWLSRHTFTWASPLVRQGYRRQLHLADIWQVWMGSSAKRMKTVSCGQVNTDLWRGTRFQPKKRQSVSLSRRCTT